MLKTTEICTKHTVCRHLVRQGYCAVCRAEQAEAEGAKMRDALAQLAGMLLAGGLSREIGLATIAEAFNAGGYTSMSDALRKTAEQSQPAPDTPAEAHQERLLAEKADVDGRSLKLLVSIASFGFDKVPKAEQERMTLQLQIMRDYSNVLDARIKAAKSSSQ